MLVTSRDEKVDKNKFTLPVDEPLYFGSIVSRTSPKHLLSSSGADHLTKV